VTVVALWDLASSHLALRKLEEAEQMMERVSELRKQTLGRDHPHTIEARYNLFAILLKAGKLDVAEARIEEVRKDLARLKQRALEQVELGKDREARSQLEELVNLCRRIMGDTEDTTLEATGYLVGLLLRTGEYRNALPCLQSLVETSKKLHGEDHPNTKAVTSLYVQTLARVFADTGAR
jgi:tetratricopeptide (TPR) repeat protein